VSLRNADRKVETMKVPLRVLLCLLASTISMFPVLASGQASGADVNLSACQHGWTGCDHAKLTPSQFADVATIEHRLNVSNCRDGLKSCDPSKLSDAELPRSLSPITKIMSPPVTTAFDPVPIHG
jgi:hypothetical protein